MQRRFTPAEKLAALARVRAGEAPGLVARSLGVTSDTLRQWRHRLERAQPSSPAPATAPPPLAGAVAPAAPSAEPAGVHEALAAAGIASAPPSVNGQTPASAHASSSSTPAGPGVPTDVQLVALLETVQGIGVRIAATASRVQLTREEFGELVKFTAEEREAHLLLAPYAAPYVPAILERMPKLFAGLFVVMFASSINQRMQHVTELAKAQRAKEKREAERAREAA